MPPDVELTVLDNKSVLDAMLMPDQKTPMSF